MKNLKVKLQNNDELKATIAEFCRLVAEYESNGIIEKVHHIAEPGEVHYLLGLEQRLMDSLILRMSFPLFLSLEPGPCLSPLGRFRLGGIGIIADIRQAFFQISVNPSPS